ncbi:hypothetical protein Q1695_000390 [Nippostrongylus brasiliensis]|nr:hypothetical protein Q1695_000390 [Nippostrongylus brasiliensis]
MRGFEVQADFRIVNNSPRLRPFESGEGTRKRRSSVLVSFSCKGRVSYEVFSASERNQPRDGTKARERESSALPLLHLQRNSAYF